MLDNKQYKFIKQKSFSNSLYSPCGRYSTKIQKTNKKQQFQFIDFNSQKQQQNLDQKILFYTNDCIKAHKIQQIRANSFIKRFHIIDSPQLIHRVAEIINQKQKQLEQEKSRVSSSQKQPKNPNLNTIQTKFRHENGVRKKYSQLNQQLKGSINSLDANKNLNLTDIIEVKQQILNMYFSNFIKQLQKECLQKAKYLQFIWLSLQELFEKIFKILTRFLTNFQQQNLNQSTKLHSQYQNYLDKIIRENRRLKKDNKEKEEFIENLVYNIRFKRRQIKQLYNGIRISTNKINQYKNLYLELEKQYIELQMEVKGISRQLSIFLKNRHYTLQRQKKQRFQLNKNKQRIKNQILQKLNKQQKSEVEKLLKNMQMNYVRESITRGKKYIMNDELEEFAARLPDQDDDFAIFQDDTYGFIDQGTNTEDYLIQRKSIGTQQCMENVEQKQKIINYNHQAVQVNLIYLHKQKYDQKDITHKKCKLNLITKLVNEKIQGNMIDSLQKQIQKECTKILIQTNSNIQNSTNLYQVNINSTQKQNQLDHKIKGNKQNNLVKKRKNQELILNRKKFASLKKSNSNLLNVQNIKQVNKINNESRKQKPKTTDIKSIKKQRKSASVKKVINNLPFRMNFYPQNSKNQQKFKIQSSKKLQREQLTKNQNIQEKYPCNKSKFISELQFSESEEIKFNQNLQKIIEQSKNKKENNCVFEEEDFCTLSSKVNTKSIQEIQFKQIQKINTQQKQQKINIKPEYNKNINSYLQIQLIMNGYFEKIHQQNKNDYQNSIKMITQNNLFKNLYKKQNENSNIHNNQIQYQNICRIIHQIYKIAFKKISKKGKITIISDCIYEYFTLNYGKLSKNKIQDKVVNFINTINNYKSKNHKISFFALLCRMQQDQIYIDIICGIDFTLFLKIYFYLNQQQNNTSQISYTTADKININFYEILAEYIGVNHQNRIKKEIECLIPQPANSKNNQIKINLEETLTFIFKDIFQLRLVYYNEYQQLFHIIRSNQHNLIQVQMFQFLVRCIQHKRNSYVDIIKTFIEQCDINIENKKFMSEYKFTYFCLKYNFVRLQEIYQNCTQNLKERNMDEINHYSQPENRLLWQNIIQYMQIELCQTTRFLNIQQKIFDYLKHIFDNNSNNQLNEILYIMIWDMIFQVQSQKFLTFTMDKNFELIYILGLKVQYQFQSSQNYQSTKKSKPI